MFTVGYILKWVEFIDRFVLYSDNKIDHTTTVYRDILKPKSDKTIFTTDIRI